MIPKVMHFGYFWEELPAWAEANIAEFKAVNPGWEVRVWRKVPSGFPYGELMAIAPTYRFRGDLVRYWIIHQYGGVWLDVDCRPIRGFDDELLRLGAFVCSYGVNAPADNWLIGGTGGHPAWWEVLVRCQRPEQWLFPQRWFGTWNTMMDAEHVVDVPGLAVLPGEAAWQIRDTSEWQELLNRKPLTGTGYVKHYRVHGQHTLPDVKGWNHGIEDLVKFERGYVAELAQAAGMPELLAKYDERRARM